MVQRSLWIQASAIWLLLFVVSLVGWGQEGLPTQPTVPGETTTESQEKKEPEKAKPEKPTEEPKPTEPGEPTTAEVSAQPRRDGVPETPQTPQPPSEQVKKRKKRPFNLKVSAHGYASLQYQVGSTVQGSDQGRQVYRYENYGLSKGFNAYGSLQVDWQLGNLSVKGEWTPARYSPTAQRFRTEYNAGSSKFVYGNLFLSLQGNQFVTFSRYAQGLQVEHRFGQAGDLTLVTFQTESQVVTDVFAGNNSPGPYFLRRSPVIEGSEQVRVDERPLRRGVDYTIDYSYGQIMFATPIPPTSTIAVSYESVGYGGGVGRFWGLRSNWRLGENSRLGLTFLAQRVPFTVTERAERFREEFFGSGTTGPLLLQVRPVAVGSEKVFVNGILQTREVHYQIDYQQGIVTFLQPVPSGAIVVVEYYRAASTRATVGNLRLFGLDWSGALGRIGRLSWQFGMSSGGDRNGWASEVRLSNEARRLAYTLRWQRIGSGFTRIDNPDFFRNDSGLLAEVRYDLLEGLSFAGSWQNMKTAGGRYFGIGSTENVSESRNRDWSLQLIFDRPKLPRVQLMHQRLRSTLTGTGSGSTTEKTFTTAYLSHRWGQWSVEGAWEKAHDDYAPLQQEGSTPTLSATSATTTRKRVSLSFQPGSKLSVLLDWSQNSADSVNQQLRSNATQRILSVNYTPWQSLQLSISHQKLNGAASASPLLGGTVLTGVVGGTLGGFGSLGLGTGLVGYGTGFGGYGTFGVGTPVRPTSGIGYGWGTTSGAQLSPWDTPSGRSRQLSPLPPAFGRRTGNASTITSFSVQWTPRQQLVFAADLTMNSDRGSELVGSLRQRDLTLSGSWQVSRKLNLFGQFTRSRTTYLDELNDSLTLMGTMGLTWGDYRGFNFSLNYQRLRMQNLRLINRIPQLEETTYSGLTATVQVPIAKRLMLRARGAQLQNNSPAGIFGGRYRTTEIEAELTYNIHRNLGLGIVWTRVKRSGDRPEQNYSASVLRAALTLQF